MYSALNYMIPYSPLPQVPTMIPNYIILEGLDRYLGQFLAPAEGFSLWPRLFLPFVQKRQIICLGQFLVLLLLFRSDLCSLFF